VPVDKQVESVGEESPLAERASMVHKGTAVTRGSGEGVVVASGMDTELGHISSLVEEAEEELTPLEKRLDQLGAACCGSSW
jgi:Ca2+-transporting ATPase